MKRLKQEIKKRMPKEICNLYTICRDNIWIAKGHHQVRKNRITRVQKNEKIRIVFIVQRTEVFNSVRTIFEDAVASDQCEVFLLPLPRCANDHKELFWDTYEAVVSFCRQLQRGIVLDTFNDQTNSYFDLTEIMPDYIFLNVPYTEQYPDVYAIKKLTSIAKVCYVPYAYSLLEKNFDLSYAHTRVAYTDFIFAANQLGYEYCRKRLILTQLAYGQMLYHIGFPRFDLLHGYYPSLGKKTILWLPRWTVNNKQQMDNEQSSFLLFFREFFHYAEAHPQIDFVIRPHPLMFDNFIQNGVMTLEEKTRILVYIAASGNIILDTASDYLASLKRADILLADYSSIVAEYYVTARPIVYFGNRDAFSRFDQPMFDTFYQINQWSEVETCLDELICGRDPKRGQRQKAVSEFLLRSEGNAGKRILDVIIQDYQKSH